MQPLPSKQASDHPVVQLEGPYDVRPAVARLLAARIAAVGADEDLDALTRELATDGGLRVAFAVAPDGRDVGVLRMVHRREATALRRLAVVPAWEAHGVAWMLADLMEDDCVAHG